MGPSYFLHAKSGDVVEVTSNGIIALRPDRLTLLHFMIGHGKLGMIFL